MPDFREGVLTIPDKGLSIMTEYLDGTRAGTDMVNEASKMIREGVKVSNRDQVDLQVKRSQAIRLLGYIPKGNRSEYIALTNPEARPFLLDKPNKKK